MPNSSQDQDQSILRPKEDQDHKIKTKTELSHNLNQTNSEQMKEWQETLKIEHKQLRLRQNLVKMQSILTQDQDLEKVVSRPVWTTATLKDTNKNIEIWGAGHDSTLILTMPSYYPSLLYFLFRPLKSGEQALNNSYNQ